MEIKEQVPLGPLATFAIGGPAAYFVATTSQEELEEALVFAKAKSLPKLILGGGSNVLLPDEGFAGLVIQVALEGIEIEEDKAGAGVTLISFAGERWDALVERAVKENLWGIENLSAIPGTVGGAVVQNIGAYGAALSEVLKWAEVLDTQTGEVRQYTNAECIFDYRDSIFKHNPDLVVLRAALQLSKVPKPNTSYKDLKARFGDSPASPSPGGSLDLRAIRAAVIEIRKGKFPDLALEGTAGSFFKNPILGVDEAKALKEKFPDMPLFAMPETTGAKAPLAWLLDHALNIKGLKLGGARLFERQPLVIAATFGTPAADVVALKEKVKQEVLAKLGITIEEEVHVI